jgi:non-canonical purine NTP pyrophosphatase (RdgB/HAM1 family)
MKTIVIATTNQGKAREMQLFFGTLKGLEWKTLADFENLEEPEENGDSFASNALLKAQYYAEQLEMPVIAEDSGLRLAAFPDKFGLKTKREITAKDDHDWIDQFLALVRDEPNRDATFYSSIAYFDPSTKTEKVVLGESAGEIVDFPQAPIEAGIPVSSVFLPEDADEVFGAMDKNTKAEFSHRGRAARQMTVFLESL